MMGAGYFRRRSLSCDVMGYTCGKAVGEMKKIIVAVLVASGCMFSSVFAGQESQAPQQKKVIILIAEQNIAGPQRAWWASEIDLSTVETMVAQHLIENGYQVLGPSETADIMRKTPAFRRVDLSEGQAAFLGGRADADYVVSGKAIASEGAVVPESRMKSYFANVTVQLIRVADKKVIAYLKSSGNSAHMDAVSGGQESLTAAGKDLAVKIVEAIKKAEGK